MNIARYVRGSSGNRGWITIIRTGSEEFSKACAAEWQRVSLCPTGLKGSDGGFLQRWSGPLADGSRACEVLPTPREEDVFALLKCVWVPPEKRTGDVLLSPYWFSEDRMKGRAHEAMKALQLASWQDVMNAWDTMRGLQVLRPTEEACNG